MTCNRRRKEQQSLPVCSIPLRRIWLNAKSCARAPGRIKEGGSQLEKARSEGYAGGHLSDEKIWHALLLGKLGNGEKRRLMFFAAKFVATYTDAHLRQGFTDSCNHEI